LASLALGLLLASAGMLRAFEDQTAARLPVDAGGLYTALAADVDGDRDLDLVLATRVGLRLLLNNGAGVFTDVSAARLPALTGAFLSAVAGDIDHDGDLDLFAADADGNGRLLLNTGSGTFADQSTTRLPMAADSAADAALVDAVLVDVDDDGDLDLVVAYRRSADRLLLNDGTGVFTEAPAERLPGDVGATSGVAAADLNGDGRPDLVFTRQDGPLRLLVNDGNGAFAESSAANLPAELPGALGVSAADMDGDGDLDLVVAGGSSGLGLLRNDGSGHFLAVAPTAAPLPAHHATMVAVGDLNEDGLPDVVVACAGQDLVLLNSGAGVLTDATATAIPADTGRTFGLVAADLDGDFDLDLALARPTLQTRLLINQITVPRLRLSAQPSLVEVGQTVAIHVEAFDEDGIATLAVTVNGSNLPLTAGNGTYIPAAPGTFTVVATATDTLTHSNTRQTTFSAVTNLAPVVHAGPDASARKGQAFTGSGSFTDPGADTWTATVNYGDGSGVQALALAPDKTFQLNHVYTTFGAFTVTVAIHDGADTGTDTRQVTVVNQPPVVTAIPPQVAQAPLPFTTIPLDDYVTDPDHTDAEITWTVRGNTALSVSISAARVATITYAAGTAAAETLTFTATDPIGLQDATAVQLVVTQVSTDFLRPVVTLAATPDTTNAGGTIQLTLAVSDASGILLRELKVDGLAVTLDGAGHGSFSSPTPGIFTAVGSALDAGGNRGETSVELRFQSPGDTTLPTVAITTPANGDEVPAAIDIEGTAADANLLRYTLEYSVKNRNEYRQFAAGGTPVVAGVLGQLDTTAMQNGIYDLRLSAEDRSGNTATVQSVIQVTAQLKVGAVSLLFKDMKVPVSGIPIALNRMYDSRDKGKGDFGYGWRLDVTSVKLTLSGPLSEEWYQTRTGFLQLYQLIETGPHYAMVDYPDGTWEAFAMRLNPTSSYLESFAGLDVDVSFVPYASTYSSLTALATNVVTLVDNQPGPVILYDTDQYQPYEPARFRLTTREGGQLVLQANGGVESITDANGNVTTFSAAGITHSSGRGLQIQRDGENRITRTTDPAGNTVTYAYDPYGDLVAVTDQLGAITRFIYDGEHNLVDMITADGVRGIRNQYDPAGRLTASTTADGSRITFTHDLNGHTETVADAAGKPHTARYDNNGYVTSTTDPLGHTSTFTYDADGHQLTASDALGNTITYTYDASGNLLTVTAPDGSLSGATFDASNNVTTVRNPAGAVTRMTYDAHGNLLTVTNALGKVRATYSYDSLGRMTGSRDALGESYAFAYNAFGDLTTITDPLGKQTTFTYDANGNRLTTARQRTLGDGTTVTEQTRFEYDGLNRLTAQVDPEGRRTEMDYTTTRHLSRSTLPGGLVHRSEYNARGFPEKAIYPDGTDQQFAFDPRGLLTATTNRDGTVTRQAFDDAGNLTQKTLPDGSSLSYQYDAAGRLLGQADALGNTSTVVLDGNSRVTQQVDALGNATTLSYNANSLLTGSTDPLGRHVGVSYDAAGRTTGVSFPGGAAVGYAYDDAGRRTAVTNERGAVMQYAYDALGRIAKVTEPLGAETSYSYDEMGHRVAVTDALGNTTRYEYNGSGRRTRRQLPLGMFETWTYDGAGNLVSHRDLNGAVTTSTYDYNRGGRRTSVLYADGSEELYSYTAAGNLAAYTDSGGTSSYEYDAAGRITRRTDPHGQVIAYTYDAAGRLATMTTPAGATHYVFDGNELLTSLTDPQNRTYTYDRNAAGQVEAVHYPNGTQTVTTYDARARVTRVEHQAPDHAILQSYDYTYDAASNRTRVVENDGRQVDYTYDTQNRLTAEIISPAGGGAIRTIAYTYDATGNRLTRNDAGTVSTYTYDANNRLLSDGTTTYAYDAAGRLVSGSAAGTSWTYAYNGRNQLVQAVRDDHGTLTTIDLVYHRHDRIATLVNGVETSRMIPDPTIGVTERVAELSPGGSVLAFTVFGEDLLSRTADGATLYYHHDGAAGSVGLLTNASGQAIATYTYDAFGRLLTSTGTAVNPHRFAGETLDGNLALYDLRARLYDPESGRFTTPDPLEGMDSDPATQNPYLYVRNNPVNSTDPSGKSENFSLASVVMTSALIVTVASIGNGILIGAGMHPFLIGKGRVKTHDVTLPDGSQGEAGFSGEWLRCYSSVDIGVGALGLSPKLLVSRASGINVGATHFELGFGLNLLGGDIGDTLGAIRDGTEAIGALAVCGAMAGNVGGPEAIQAFTRFAEGCFADLAKAGEFVTQNYSVGTSIGLSAAHLSYSSTSLAGLNIGGSVGMSVSGVGASVGFDIGTSYSLNIPPNARGGEMGGLLGPPYESPSVQLVSAFGSVSSKVRATFGISYAWPMFTGD
jgi:RHS repeat-associated protein